MFLPLRHRRNRRGERSQRRVSVGARVGKKRWRDGSLSGFETSRTAPGHKRGVRVRSVIRGSRCLPRLAASCARARAPLPPASGLLLARGALWWPTARTALVMTSWPQAARERGQKLIMLIAGSCGSWVTATTRLGASPLHLTFTSRSSKHRRSRKVLYFPVQTPCPGQQDGGRGRNCLEICVLFFNLSGHSASSPFKTFSDVFPPHG